MKPFTTRRARASTAGARNHHTALLGLGAAFLTGAVLYFNGSYGLTFGYGMAAAFIGFAIVKDAGISYAWAARGERGRIAAGLLGLIGFTISCLAAIGAASHSRQESSDPKAALIAAYDAAEKQATEAEAKLKTLGNPPSVDQASARQAQIVVDAAIFKRTNGCRNLVNPDSTKQTRVNTETCQPYVKAGEMIATATEAAKWQAKLDAAREVTAKGKPASADAQATTLAALFSLFTVLHGIEGIQAWTNLLIGLGLEIGSPLAWAAFAAARAHRTTLAEPAAASECGPEETFAAAKSAALANVQPTALTGLFSGEQPERLPENDPPQPPKGGPRKRKTSSANESTAAKDGPSATIYPFPANHPVVAALKAAGGSVSSNRQLAALMGVTDGEATKRRQEIEHLLTVAHAGKARRIALK